ncbi:hypothetical protein [Noviherbaspirillum aridicola]|uniref:DUF58 domain-containing protein n=1 Tax=Noviherbaspirillum aridicola TaxID=2849687 RepID=A0ABQ4Q3T0_9BURK|nr:hypothetical protein [Noviherbaspirillum aridicola]GIZ51843.1 hypothetical protein NCCP691_18570 [Noviherbaspirillum aridicola]
MSARGVRVWRAPLIVGALTVAGLLAALVGDGAWDWAGAAALAVPAWLCAWYGVLRR